MNLKEFGLNEQKEDKPDEKIKKVLAVVIITLFLLCNFKIKESL